MKETMNEEKRKKRTKRKKETMNEERRKKD